MTVGVPIVTYRHRVCLIHKVHIRVRRKNGRIHKAELHIAVVPKATATRATAAVVLPSAGTCVTDTVTCTCHTGSGHLPGVASATPVLLKHLCSHRVSRTSVFEETHPRLFQSLQTMVLAFTV